MFKRLPLSWLFDTSTPQTFRPERQLLEAEDPSSCERLHVTRLGNRLALAQLLILCMPVSRALAGASNPSSLLRGGLSNANALYPIVSQSSSPKVRLMIPVLHC
jgi:hypothetical protein